MLAPDWSMAVSPANQRAGRSLSVTGSDLDLNQGNVLILFQASTAFNIKYYQMINTGSYGPHIYKNMAHFWWTGPS